MHPKNQDEHYDQEWRADEYDDEEDEDEDWDLHLAPKPAANSGVRPPIAKKAADNEIARAKITPSHHDHYLHHEHHVTEYVLHDGGLDEEDPVDYDFDEDYPFDLSPDSGGLKGRD